jgi:hypothetical protein
MNIVTNLDGSISLLDLHTGDIALLRDALQVHATLSERNGAVGTAKSIKAVLAELNQTAGEAVKIRAAKSQSPIADSKGGAL